MAGLQCQKRLWLQTHRRDLIQDDNQQAYAAGNELGEAARRGAARYTWLERTRRALEGLAPVPGNGGK